MFIFEEGRLSNPDVDPSMRGGPQLPCPDCNGCGLCTITTNTIDFSGNLFDLSAVPEDQKIQVQTLFKMAGFEKKIQQWGSSEDTGTFSFQKFGRSFEGTISRTGDITLTAMLLPREPIPTIHSVIPVQDRTSIPTPATEASKEIIEVKRTLTELPPYSIQEHISVPDQTKLQVPSVESSTEQHSYPKTEETLPQANTSNIIEEHLPVLPDSPSVLTSEIFVPLRSPIHHELDLDRVMLTKPYQKDINEPHIEVEFVDERRLFSKPEVNNNTADGLQVTEERTNHLYDRNNTPVNMSDKTLTTRGSEIQTSLIPVAAENDIQREYIPLTILPTEEEIAFWVSQVNQDSEAAISENNQTDIPHPAESSGNEIVVDTVVEKALIDVDMLATNNDYEMTAAIDEEELDSPIGSQESHHALISVITTHKQARQTLLRFLTALSLEFPNTQKREESEISSEITDIPVQILRQFLLGGGAIQVDMQGEITFHITTPKDMHLETYRLQENGEFFTVQLVRKISNHVEFIANTQTKQIIYKRLKKYIHALNVEQDTMVSPEEDEYRLPQQIQDDSFLVGLLYIVTILILIPELFERQLVRVIQSQGNSCACSHTHMKHDLLELRL